MAKGNTSVAVLTSKSSALQLDSNKASGTSPSVDFEFLPIEAVASKLHQTVEWVQSKCRRRCPNPIPFHNVGNHRLFLWSEVFAWVIAAPKVIHSRHRRRTKEQIQKAAERLET